MTRAELAQLLGVTLQAPAPQPSAPVVISEGDPQKFMAAFAGAVASGGTVLLADPNWGENERTQLAELVGSSGFSSQLSAFGHTGWLMIPTGGTSGHLKFARHDEQTLSAAVRGFATHFEISRINAMGVLPLPEGYDPHQQVAKNSMKKQFKAFGWRIALGALVIVTLLVLGVRRLLRRRGAS